MRPLYDYENAGTDKFEVAKSLIVAFVVEQLNVGNGELSCVVNKIIDVVNSTRDRFESEHDFELFKEWITSAIVTVMLSKLPAMAKNVVLESRQIRDKYESWMLKYGDIIDPAN